MKKLLLLVLVCSTTDCMFSGWFGGKKPENIEGLVEIIDNQGTIMGSEKIVREEKKDGIKTIHQLYDTTGTRYLGDFIIYTGATEGYHIKSALKGQSALFDALVNIVAKQHNINIRSSFPEAFMPQQIETKVSVIHELSEEEAQKLEAQGIASKTPTRIEESKEILVTAQPSYMPTPRKQVYEGGLIIEEIDETAALQESVRILSHEFLILTYLLAK